MKLPGIKKLSGFAEASIVENILQAKNPSVFPLSAAEV